jgi:outer membrane protein OmpA-like peptidoglycan-associated protein
MRKLAGAIAAAVALSSGAALARDKAWYVEADTGVTTAPDRNIKLTGGPGVLGSKTGTDVGVELGYDFGKFRFETETSMRRAIYRSLDAGSGFGGVAAPATYSGPTLSGHTDVLSMMMNGLFDFGPSDATYFLFGGGVGIARVRDTLATTGVPYYTARKAGFAWQLLAGISVPVTRKWDAGIRYRYFKASGADRLVDGKGRVLHDTFSSHSLLATLTYNLGSAPRPAGAGAEPPPASAPTPPPPPPPPPPSPPPPVCNKGPYIVFFDWNRAEITPEAATILDGAVQAYANCGTVPVMLAGYADRSGGVKYNLGLSARRDTAVQNYLTGRGIPASAISSHAFGEANPRVPTRDGVRELQNRRVEITYGPGSGN